MVLYEIYSKTSKVMNTYVHGLYITSKKVKSVLFLSSNDCFIKESSFSICLGVDGFNRVLLLS